MIDQSSIAIVRDAVARIREVIPSDVEAFASDRTAREVVMWNSYVACRGCIQLAFEWLLAVEREFEGAGFEMFQKLSARGLIEPALASRLGLAARQSTMFLIAHLSWTRHEYEAAHAFATTVLDDLLAFCEQVPGQANDPGRA